MISSSLALLQKLQNKIDISSVDASSIGRLGNVIAKITTAGEKAAYLKIGQGAAGRDLQDEAQRLLWIGDRLPVPKVLFREDHAEWTSVLISELPGIPGHEAARDGSIEQVLEIFADGIRRVHAMPTADCPFTRVVERDLEESARRVGAVGLDEDAFVADTGIKPGILLDKLAAQAAAMEWDNVFTHGDYCLPNLLIEKNALGGIIDWGTAGVCDRNRDFMSIELTIRRNFGEEWIPRFYEAYGNSSPDPDRIRFFWLLDRYFFHFANEMPTGAEPRNTA